MLKTLPYNALRTLESVVRLRGFGRAAEELNVTQSAVSQHVKQLEEWLGHPLLVRQGRVTTPTPVGEQVARATRDGFGQIETLCDTLRGAHVRADNGILVAAPPGFAYLWLLPRLLRFDESHPDIPVSISTDPMSRTHARSDADVVISYSTGGFPGLYAEPLMAEHMSPICEPGIARALHDVEDLRGQVILEDSLETSEAASNWTVWAREVNKTLPAFTKVRKYGQANLVIQAAISGRGVAMGRSPLVADALQAGTLVHPFPWVAPSQSSYWIVGRHDVLKSPSVTAFRNWLHAEAAISTQADHQ